MTGKSDERAVLLGEYIVRHGATVRDAAQVFGISKSTVHTDVSKKLKSADAQLWRRVRAVLDVNKAQRHIRGGMATKEKYLREREKCNGESKNVRQKKEKQKTTSRAF